MRRQDVAVAVTAERLQQPRGAFDIGEQKGDRARGQAWRSLTNVSSRQSGSPRQNDPDR